MATKKTEKIIIELDFDTSDFTKDAAKLNGEIKKLNEEQKKLKKSGEEGSIQYQKNTQALKENKAALSETNKTITNLNKANKSAAGSNDQLKAQLSLLTAEYNKLSKEERQTSERGKQLKAQTIPREFRVLRMTAPMFAQPSHFQSINFGNIVPKVLKFTVILSSELMHTESLFEAKQTVEAHMLKGLQHRKELAPKVTELAPRPVTVSGNNARFII